MAARGEAGHGDAEAAGQGGGQRRARVEQRPDARRLVPHEGSQARRRSFGQEIVDRALEPAEILRRQVDAAPLGVLAHVLQVLDQLQTGADPIGQGDPFRRSGVEDAQDQLPYRVGRQLAVAEELLPRLVAMDALIDALDTMELAFRRLAGMRRNSSRRRLEDVLARVVSGAIEDATEPVNT